MTRCWSCGAPILWARTLPARRAMPVDATPSPRGNVRLERIADDVYIAHVEPGPIAGLDMYTSHFATCPQAEQHRRRRSSKVKA